MSTVIGILQVRNVGWVWDAEGAKPDGSLFSKVWMKDSSDQGDSTVFDAVKDAQITIDLESHYNDWVDITRTVDDRISYVQCGDYIVVTEDLRVSILSGVTDVSVDEFGVVAIKF